jgi:uncharacterized protein (TIGR03118 family)
MDQLFRALTIFVLIGNLFTSVGEAQNGGYVETDLVVNKQVNDVPTLVDSNGTTHVAKFADANLVNPWGLTASATSALWVGNGGTGVATLYNSQGTPQALVVSIPSAADPLGNGGIPTGAVFNNAPAGSFKLTGVDRNGETITAPAVFLFATKDGNILGWNPNVNPPGFDPAKLGKYAIIAVPNSASAAYTGLALATVEGNTRLYAANFRAGTVDVFDTSFNKEPASNEFADPTLPKGYAPFNVASITNNGKTRIFVAYAKPSDVFGQGHGFVNTFRPDGTERQRFSQRGQLNAPWGMVLTPSDFGELGGKLWIGNFGDGRINAFDPDTGEFIDKVRTPEGKAISIDGLWSMRFGNGSSGGSPATLYFTAGPNGEADGLFGSLDKN